MVVESTPAATRFWCCTWGRCGAARSVPCRRHSGCTLGATCSRVCRLLHMCRRYSTGEDRAGQDRTDSSSSSSRTRARLPGGRSGSRDWGRSETGSPRWDGGREGWRMGRGGSQSGARERARERWKEGQKRLVCVCVRVCVCRWRPAGVDRKLWGRRSHVNYKGRGSRDSEAEPRT